jgi:hypothetical protein
MLCEVSFHMPQEFSFWFDFSSIKKCFFFKKDNPGHNIPIVGGYWGLANSRNRPLADYLFKILTNKLIAGYYNPGDRNLKGYDQFLLKMFFARYSLRNSTTHDSYSCSYLGGQPWPSKRPSGYCFVGCTWCCDQPEAESKANFICPKSCRPKEHQDWIFC